MKLGVQKVYDEITSQKSKASESRKSAGDAVDHHEPSRGRTYDIPTGSETSNLFLRRQKTNRGPGGKKSSNREMEENNSKKTLIFLTEVKENNIREETGRRKIGPSRHEISVSNISNPKSLYDWYQYLKKSGRFRFNAN